MKRTYDINDFLRKDYLVLFRLKYVIEEKGNIFFIVATEDEEVKAYDPFSEILIPRNQTQKSDDWIKASPHIALMRIDLKRNEDILKFVNQWGLLGLGHVKGYKIPELTLNGSLYDPDTGLKCDDSAYFINSFYERKGDLYYFHQFQEPLETFKQAALDFQKLSSLIIDPNVRWEWDEEPKKEIQWKLNGYLSECFPVSRYDQKNNKWSGWWHTGTPLSLLHVCYLLLWMDLMEARKYKLCEHNKCGKPFFPNRDNAIYCSNQCAVNAKRRRNYKKTGK